MTARSILLVIVPYILSKAAIACSLIVVQALFARIGGATLAAEAAALQFEFLIYGAAMGGMSAVTIMAASSFSFRRDSVEDCCSCDSLQILLHGHLRIADADADAAPPSQADEYERRVLVNQPNLPIVLNTQSYRMRLRLIFTVSFAATSVFAAAATLLLVFAAALVQLFVPRMPPTTLAALGAYCRGLAWGTAPLLWLYCIEQFLLGVHAAGAAFLFGTAYAVVSSLLSWAWYEASGAQGIGLAMSLAAWIVFILASIAMALDPTFRHVCSVVSLADDLLQRRAEEEDPASSSSHLTKTMVEYLQLATPLALSNMVGLVVSLVIAAAVDDSGNNTRQQKAFSVANSYYQALLVAVLGCSSAISSIVASSSSASATSTDDEDSNGVSKQAQNTVALRTCIMVFVCALVLALLPFFAQRPFVEFFGGTLLSGDAARSASTLADVTTFLIPCCLAFCVTTLAMCAAATVHAARDVSVPLLFHTVAYSLGAVWIIVARNWRDSDVVAAAYGTIVGPALYFAALSWRWATRHT